jgi:sulfur carrier protein
MKVMVNDEELEIGDDTTVTALLGTLGFPDRGIAVAVNWTVLPRSQWNSLVPEGARVEVVTAVQGG